MSRIGSKEKIGNGPLKAPFPYFGGKSRVADIVWSRFGDVRNYVEPFFGSGAVLLARPPEHFEGDTQRIETANDINGNEGNVRAHTLSRLDSFVEATFGRHITYKELIA